LGLVPLSDNFAAYMFDNLPRFALE